MLRNCILSRFAPLGLHASHLHSQSLCSLKLLRLYLACFARTRILARFTPYDTHVYYIVSRFTSSGFLLCSRILSHFATSGFALAFLVASLHRAMCFTLTVSVALLPRA